MPSLADKVTFATKHITTPDGEPFSLKGREWVLDQMWRPLDGWKLWPEKRGELCIDCGICAKKCPVKCITGERKKLHVIDQQACTKCGTCYDKCPFAAIAKV